MDELIRRLEEATEGNRELDAEIVVALDIRPEWLVGQKGEMWIEVRRHADSPPDIRWKDSRVRRGAGNPTAWHSWPYIATALVYPHLTASFDAARTLLPEGAEYSISTLHGIAAVDLPLNSDNPQMVRRTDGNVILAFVEACLRAHQATKDSQT